MLERILSTRKFLFVCVTIPPKWIWEWGEFFRAQKDCERSIRELGGSCVCVCPAGHLAQRCGSGLMALIHASLIRRLESKPVLLVASSPLRALPSARHFAANSQKWLHEELSSFLRLLCYVSLLRGPSPAADAQAPRSTSTLPPSQPCQDRLV